MATKDVNLQIKDTSGGGRKPVVGSDGTTVYYKYTGGNVRGNASDKGKGDNEFVADNVPETFSIEFNAGTGRDYKFVTDPQAFLNKDNSPDLSATNTDDVVTVTDTCQTVGEWEYGVKVEDRTSGETFECDPVIKNWA